MTKILIVEDEEAISDLIKMSLTKAGYHCEQAMDGLEAADCIENNNYDLILLDIMLPEINGYELLEYIKTKETPVIFITAMGELNDRVKGLRAGADDYITKPYNPTILLLRIQNIFKRMEISKEDMNYDGIIVNPKKGILEKDGKTLELTKNEMIIFSFLLSNRGKIVTRDDLMTDLWNNNEFINDNALTVNISRLRSKLQDFGLENKIETRKGQGYKLL